MPEIRAIQCFACSCARPILFHVKSWDLIVISNWKRAKTCLTYNNWRDLPHLGGLLSGMNRETDTSVRSLGRSCDCKSSLDEKEKTLWSAIAAVIPARLSHDSRVRESISR
ncbi:hypothetical protein Y032_0062g3328 [Ancylostoma ceylanicum]|uniref:Uncharacterized protein n=1 Tax=Ancylostoma ceylanicum TaxID=53326 RepID=A0A016U1B5_9BILA|nr:hypothetical protein Y032_0062g3328 [Ancylostoma ceylanicum]